MKMICWNLRGIGGGNKIREVAKWVSQRRIDFIALIETMKGDISEFLIRRLWGSDDYNWASVDAQGRSGGILCIWNSNFITVEAISKEERWIWIKGFFQDMRMAGVIGIIYGFHNNADKARLKAVAGTTRHET